MANPSSSSSSDQPTSKTRKVGGQHAASSERRTLGERTASAWWAGGKASVAGANMGVCAGGGRWLRRAQSIWRANRQVDVPHVACGQSGGGSIGWALSRRRARAKQFDRLGGAFSTTEVPSLLLGQTCPPSCDVLFSRPRPCQLEPCPVWKTSKAVVGSSGGCPHDPCVRFFVSSPQPPISPPPPRSLDASRRSLALWTLCPSVVVLWCLAVDIHNTKLTPPLRSPLLRKAWHRRMRSAWVIWAPWAKCLPLRRVWMLAKLMVASPLGQSPLWATPSGARHVAGAPPLAVRCWPLKQAPRRPISSTRERPFLRR